VTVKLIAWGFRQPVHVVLTYAFWVTYQASGLSIATSSAVSTSWLFDRDFDVEQAVDDFPVGCALHGGE
jgi:hypothetical protein